MNDLSEVDQIQADADVINHIQNLQGRPKNMMPTYFQNFQCLDTIST